MKEYVLDDPLLRRAAFPVGEAEPLAPPPEDSTRFLGLQRTTWRTIGVLLLLEPLVLLAFYWALGEPSLPWSAERTAAPVEAPAPAVRARPPAPVAVAAPAPAPAPPRLRIAAERGKVVVDLVAAPAQDAVARLAAVTRSEVSGAQIFAAGHVQLTRSTVAASPREAWQAVFGPVANFAIACAADGCRVRFISLIDDAGRAATAATPPPMAFSPPPAIAVAPPVAAVPAPVEPVRPAVPPATAPPVVAAPGAEDPNASEN